MFSILIQEISLEILRSFLYNLASGPIEILREHCHYQASLFINLSGMMIGILGF